MPKISALATCRITALLERCSDPLLLQLAVSSHHKTSRHKTSASSWHVPPLITLERQVHLSKTPQSHAPSTSVSPLKSIWNFQCRGFEGYSIVLAQYEYFWIVWIASVYQYLAIGVEWQGDRWRTKWKEWERTDRGPIEVTSRHLSVRDSFNQVGLCPCHIATQDLLHRSLKR
jgi:hypothetical protein